MPAADQDHIASAILSMAQLFDQRLTDIDADERRDVLDALAEVERGEIATPDEVAAAWSSFEK